MDKRSDYGTGYSAPDPYKRFALVSAIVALVVLLAYVLQQMGVIPNKFL
jgi:hypothetical protein